MIGGQLKQYVVFTGHINLFPGGSETHLDGSGHSLEVPEGPGSAPEVPRMSRNGPGRSCKLLEAHGRFRTVPPLRPWPWGASHLGSPGWSGRGRRTKEGESSSKWDYQIHLWKVSGGKVSEGLEGLGVQVGLPNLFGLHPRPPGHLYKGGQGGREHTSLRRPLALPSC